MIKRKLTKESLAELAARMPVLSENAQRGFIGGGKGTENDPFTEAEYDQMVADGTWNGGYVDGWGYTFSDVTITGSQGSSNNNDTSGNVSGSTYNPNEWGGIDSGFWNAGGDSGAVGDSGHWWEYGPSGDISGQIAPGAGGGGGSQTGVTPTHSYLIDPNKILKTTTEFLTTRIVTLEDMLQNGTLPKTGKDYLNALKKSQNTIETMKNQKGLIFRIAPMQSNGDDRLDANIHYDKKTGEVIFNIENIENSNNISLVIHELTHIQQLIDGKLWIENGEIKGYDIYDELEAYTQKHLAEYGVLAGSYDLMGNHYPDGNYTVTIDEIKKAYPGVYDHLPTTEISK